MSSTTSTPATRIKKRRVAPGWIPNYHGAWAMVIVPPILGAILGGWRPEHALLFAFWMVGYFDFFAIGQWLRSRFKARYRPPVIMYTALATALGLAVLAVAPRLLVWVPVFLPLIALTFLASWHRADRSFLNDLVTITAGTLMLPVSYHLAVGSDAVNWLPVWIATLVVFGYFVGTVFYVKTNIRERGQDTWLRYSLLWHLALTAIAFWLAIVGKVSMLHPLVWVVLTIRAVAVPMYGQRHGWLSAKAIGIGEFVLTILVSLTLII